MATNQLAIGIRHSNPKKTILAVSSESMIVASLLQYMYTRMGTEVNTPRSQTMNRNISLSSYRHLGTPDWKPIYRVCPKPFLFY